MMMMMMLLLYSWRLKLEGGSVVESINCPNAHIFVRGICLAK